MYGNIVGVYLYQKIDYNLKILYYLQPYTKSVTNQLYETNFQKLRFFFLTMDSILYLHNELHLQVTLLFPVLKKYFMKLL